MEFNIEIVAYLAFVIANISAIFFVRSNFASMVVIYLSIIFFIIINISTFGEDPSFLKISFALFVMLVIANSLFSKTLIENKETVGVTKIHITFLSITFISLLFAIPYLDSASSKNRVIHQAQLKKDKSNIALVKSRKIQKLQHLVKHKMLTNNLSLIILFLTFLPIMLLPSKDLAHENI
ncbi:MAG: hypothetical protein ISQ34_00170 [Rickettsiales bacterium]|nr:hypothetical protein [Rickettsiales bacterium]